MKQIVLIVLKRRVKGGALYYAIFVMLLLSLLSVLLLSYFELEFREDTRFYKQAELNDQLQSVLTLISCQPQLLDENSAVDLDVYSDGTAMVSAVKERWGFLNKIKVSTQWRNLRAERTSLMAEQEKERPALWMPDHKRYVSLVGQSYINGTCYLSELGLRKGNAEGRYFEGPYLHKGKLERSSQDMPELKKEIIQFYQGYSSGQTHSGDSLINFNSINKSEPFNQPFTDKTVVIQSPGRMVLDKGQFSGNIVFVSSDTIEIWPSIHLNNCILIGKGIVIKDGFKGNLQAMASGSVIVGKDCQLSYPSFVAVISLSAQANITIQQGSKINGGVVCYAQSPQEGKTNLRIEKGVKIIGKAFVNGDLTFSGHVSGSLYCNRFVHRTSRAFYENFMIDCSIDESELAEDYASFCLTDQVYKLKEVQSW